LLGDPSRSDDLQSSPLEHASPRLAGKCLSHADPSRLLGLQSRYIVPITPQQSRRRAFIVSTTLPQSLMRAVHARATRRPAVRASDVGRAIVRAGFESRSHEEANRRTNGISRWLEDAGRWVDRICG
jgi:hypothetical protein